MFHSVEAFAFTFCFGIRFAFCVAHFCATSDARLNPVADPKFPIPELGGARRALSTTAAAVF
jgi:hypothetical protein